MLRKIPLPIVNRVGGHIVFAHVNVHVLEYPFRDSTSMKIWTKYYILHVFVRRKTYMPTSEAHEVVDNLASFYVK